MQVVVVFAITLVIAVLLSGLANRSILSTAVIFLLAGFIAGPGVLGVMTIQFDNEVVSTFAQLALFSVLYTDGMRVKLADFNIAKWKLPGRALFLGLPLTLLGNAVLAHFIVGLSWLDSFLLGAVLTPTDPVFASAIVGREEVPGRVRSLLNIESGMNDGLALPFVVAFLALMSAEKPDVPSILLNIVLGIVIGIVTPLIISALSTKPIFSVSSNYLPLLAVSIGVMVYALATVFHGNEFLAAFTAGITLAAVNKDACKAFHEFGEVLAELFKVATLLLFGALITPSIFSNTDIFGYIFAVLVLVAVRPLALALALLGARLSWLEWFTTAWFGPKGFASVFYGFLILRSGIARTNEIITLTAIVVVFSIVAHSSTDVIVANWFKKANEEAERKKSNKVNRTEAA
ncbi:MAG TPA: cation:proton antiporter [Chloroflexia bacterium]|nr:cation:proton antiporter [Chloroflexia bacterium]